MGSSYYRARARQILSGKWGMAVLVTLLAGFFGAHLVASSFRFEIKVDEDTFLREFEAFIPLLRTMITTSSFLGILQFVLGGVMRLGYCRYLLNLHDGDPADVKDLFSQFSRFGDAFVLNLLEALYVFLWSLLFIIPGIVAIFKYAMAPFILLENPGMRPGEALTASKQMMDGNKASLFWLQLSFIGWTLLSALTLGIGNLWVNPYMNVAYTAFYRGLRPRTFPQPESPFAPAPDPTID